MNLIDRLTHMEKVSEGMSPAETYRCRIEDTVCYLKKIDEVFSPTTYSVQREADVMLWLADKLNVPAMMECGRVSGKEYLIMSEVKGRHIDDFVESPLLYVTNLAKALKQLWSIDTSACRFSSRLDVRLQELDYLLKNGLADVNPAHWQNTTTFTEPAELYVWLCSHRPPEEELVFSHGDLGANFLVADDEIIYFDLARCGIADKWQDIALCVRDIREYGLGSSHEEAFFQMLGVEPDQQKLDYYVLLDELF